MTDLDVFDEQSPEGSVQRMRLSMVRIFLYVPRDVTVPFWLPQPRYVFYWELDLRLDIAGSV